MGATYGVRVDLGNELETLEVVKSTAADDGDLDGLQRVRQRAEGGPNRGMQVSVPEQLLLLR